MRFLEISFPRTQEKTSNTQYTLSAAPSNNRIPQVDRLFKKVGSMLDATRSCQQLGNDIATELRELLVPTGVVEGQLVVVQAKQVQ